MKLSAKINPEHALLLVFTLPLWLLPRPSFAQSNPTYDSVIIDSLDADGWNGVTFLAKAFNQQIPFAIRFGSRSGSFLDGEQIFEAVREVGPHAPDGSYCRMAWWHYPRQALITLEWSRVDQTTVVGRITAAKDFNLVLESYFPFEGVNFGMAGGEGVYSFDEAHQAVLGERYLDKVFGPTARFVVMVDRPAIGGVYPDLAKLVETIKVSGTVASAAKGTPWSGWREMDDLTAGAAGLGFATDGSHAHFVAVLGWERDTLIHHAQDLLATGKIDAILKAKEAGYAARRPAVTGLFAGAPEAIGNSMFWNSVYAQSADAIFPSIGRRWAHQFGGWMVGEWDCFFGSLLTSLEDKAQTVAAIKAILLGQTDTGMVPSTLYGAGSVWDSSQPPVGSFITWKVYQRLQDRELLEWAYPRLKKWHEWWLHDRGDGQPWRDGNRDGLLEWGSDRGSSHSVGGRGFLYVAKWETGMDDSPMYDDATYDPHTYTMNLDDVALNSFYASDAECLARIASILGRDSDAQEFTAEYERLKQLIRDKLWNEQDGIFENRFWSGEFSKRLSPTNFYPLFAGIATPEQAKRMVEEHLLNPREFWGEYVIPSIARNDPAFPDQYYWRGSIWGPTNYIAYQGLMRYGFDKVALEVAQKSYTLFMDDWKKNQHYNEQYLAWGGYGGGDPHYTWGTLLCLMALEQYIDKSPWDGLRFGALNPTASGEFRGATWDGHTYDTTIGSERTALARDGKLRFEATGGVVVRNYQPAPARLAFALKTDKPVGVTTAEFDSGEFRLIVDGKPVGKVSIREGRGHFSVPAGDHEVELAK